MSDKPETTHTTDGHDAANCDGCLVLTMVTRAETAEAALRATWAALDKANALNPEDFKTGQGHLSPAFREVNFRAAFKAMVDVVNEIEQASGYADRVRTPSAVEGGSDV